MGRFNIVIEGIDGTGKSTLAEKLWTALPLASLINSSATKPSSRQDLLVALSRARRQASFDTINIFDRFCAISESVYQDNGALRLDEVEQELEDCKIDLLIWARKPLSKCVTRVREDDPRDVEYNKTLGPRLPEIDIRYEALMPVLMDFMLARHKHFELYNSWEQLDVDFLIHKIELLAGYNK